jgi:hypothetical protein
MRKGTNIFLWLCIVCHATVVNSWGSELATVFVYLCNASELTEAAVNACQTRYPSLAGRASVAINGWHTRNAEDIKKLAQWCPDTLQKNFPSPEKYAEAQKEIEKLKSEMLKSYPEMARIEGEAYCRQYIANLDSGENDLTHLLR